MPMAIKRRVGDLRGRYADDKEALVALYQLAREPEMRQNFTRTAMPMSFL
jgi:hypothetical protein